MERLTPSERAVLQDQLRHEQVCISKYRSYASQAGKALRDLFNEFAQDEENHYQALSSLLSGGAYRFRGELKDGFDQQAATSDRRSIPVDAFGRQGEWRSSARQMLSEQQPDSWTNSPSRQPHWGGMRPGDVSDTNHGDLTRGGLDRRGVNLSGANYGHLDVHEGYPSPPGVHVMTSRLVRDGQDVARVWGEPDTRGPVSLPSTRMEVAQLWDGSGPSPWSDLTSPAPLDAGTEGQADPVNANDQTMLNDMLMTERFISNAYDSAVFDSANPQVRRALQEIQRDEQRHGERISAHLAGKS